MASKRGIDLSPIRHYDKALAVLALLGLLLSLFLLARFGAESHVLEERHRQAVDALKPAYPEAAPQDLAPYEQALSDLHHPLHVEISTNEAGMFVPERRVWCVDCRYPIPFLAEVCPFCKAQQPPVKEGIGDSLKDTDGDGLPDAWMNRYFGHPLASADDHSLAREDADGDGFSNLEEFQVGANPRDPTDHPDYATAMRLVSVKSKGFPFVFTSATIMPGGKSKCSFNLKGSDVTLFADEGKPIGKTGLTLAKYTRRIEKKPNPALGNMLADVDVSEVQLLRPEDQKTFTLRRDDNQSPMEQEVTLQLTLLGKTTEHHCAAGGALEVRGEKYQVTVIDVDGQASSVVLENIRTGKKSTLSP